MMTDPINPREFARTVVYENPKAEFRNVITYNRYTFGIKNCDLEKNQTFVLEAGEDPPESLRATHPIEFGHYRVYKQR